MDEPKRILIVDDRKPSRELLRSMVQSLGHEPELARDGIEALAKLNTGIDLVLLDVMMPKMNGFEVAKRLREDDNTRTIPIVMVTSLDAAEDRAKAFDAGADDFLTKPVDKIELRARVRSLLKVKAYNDLMRDYQKQLEVEVAQKTEELSQAFEKVKDASLETIYRLSRAAETKDGDTGAHIQRVSRYAAAVARRMGLDEQTAEDILYAAPMHDVGKIGTPDHILQKPGRLIQDEWEIMKQHAAIGARILEGSNAEFIKLAEVIALTHHEQWSGAGYSRGLRGREIPLAGRIAAIADVFDALTSRRPYRREPLSLQEALSWIERERGKHFDPEVVEAFLAALEEILSIREEHK